MDQTREPGAGGAGVGEEGMIAVIVGEGYGGAGETVVQEMCDRRSCAGKQQFCCSRDVSAV